MGKRFKVGDKVEYYDRMTNRWKQAVITEIGQKHGKKTIAVKVKSGEFKNRWGYPDQIRGRRRRKKRAKKRSRRR